MTYDSGWIKIDKRGAVSAAIYPVVIYPIKEDTRSVYLKLIDNLIDLRDDILRHLEPFRAAKNKTVDAKITIRIPGVADWYPATLEELKELFIVSEVSLDYSDDSNLYLRISDAESDGGTRSRSWHKCPRCGQWHPVVDNYDDLCDRCCAVIVEFHPNHESVPGIIESVRAQKVKYKII